MKYVYNYNLLLKSFLCSAQNIVSYRVDVPEKGKIIRTTYGNTFRNSIMILTLQLLILLDFVLTMNIGLEYKQLKLWFVFNIMFNCNI